MIFGWNSESEMMEKNNKPRVSVVTIVFNGVDYLEDTIKSVIEQRYDNIEYIIIDGGSTDGTVDIIKRYENNIDYWVSETDRGIYDAMNKGINVSHGCFISFMNAGDKFSSRDELNKCEAYFENSDLILGKTFYSNGQYFQSSSSRMWLKNNMQHQSVIYSKDLFEKYGLYDLSYRILSDYEANIRFLKNGAKCTLVNFSALCDAHGLSSTGKWVGYKEEINIRNKYYPKFFVFSLYSFSRFMFKKIKHFFR